MSMTAPLQVLVAGSDADAAAFITSLITSAGLHAISTTSAHAAAVTNAETPGVILVDRDLAAVRSIRALADSKKAAIPIVVLGTDGALASEATEAKDAGATHYVERPITEDTLMSGLRSMLNLG